MFLVDGSYKGIRYFETDADRGLFCRPDKVQRLSLNGASQRPSQYDPSRITMLGIYQFSFEQFRVRQNFESDQF